MSFECDLTEIIKGIMNEEKLFKPASDADVAGRPQPAEREYLVYFNYAFNGQCIIKAKNVAEAEDKVMAHLEEDGTDSLQGLDQFGSEFNVTGVDIL